MCIRSHARQVAGPSSHVQGTCGRYCPTAIVAHHVWLLKGSFTLKTDVWACGVLLWECWSYGDLPYGPTKGTHACINMSHACRSIKVYLTPHLGVGEAYEQAFRSGLRLTQPERCPDAVFAIAQDCWHSSRAEVG
jgi:hypothetical protein